MSSGALSRHTADIGVIRTSSGAFKLWRRMDANGNSAGKRFDTGHVKSLIQVEAKRMSFSFLLLGETASFDQAKAIPRV